MGGEQQLCPEMTFFLQETCKKHAKLKFFTSSVSEAPLDESLLVTWWPGSYVGLPTLSSSEDRSESFFSCTTLPFLFLFFGGLVVCRKYAKLASDMCFTCN